MKLGKDKNLTLENVCDTPELQRNKRLVTAWTKLILLR